MTCRFVWWVCLALLVTACHGHVSLEAPPRNAPSDARVKAFRERLQPVTHEESAYAVAWTEDAGMTRFQLPDIPVDDHLLLADGTQVIYPEDLLAVLPPYSPAASAAADSRDDRRAGAWLNAGGWLLTAASLALVLVPPRVSNTSQFDLGTMIGGGLLFSGGLVSFYIGGTYERAAEQRKKEAFELYELGLLDHLGLCLDGAVMRACEEARERIRSDSELRPDGRLAPYDTQW